MKKALLLLGMAWLSATAFAQLPGDLDSTFSGNGYLTESGSNPDFTISFTNVEAMADGRIVAAGGISSSFTDSYFLVRRYMDNGDLDTTFAHTGKVELNDYGISGDHISMDLQSDGKILVAGTINSLGTDFNIIYRLNVDGSPDSTFGADGVVLEPLTPESQQFYRVFAAPSGRILATSSGDLGISVTAFQTNGLKDLAYGSGDGTVYVPFGSGQQPFLIGSFLQADEKMLTLSYLDSATHCIVRVDAQGVADSTLDTDGVQFLTYQNLGCSPNNITAGASGEIFVSANLDLGNFQAIAVVKFLPSGTKDTGFGNNGMARLGEANTDFYPYAIMIAPDGRVIVSGEVYSIVNGQGIFMGRLMPNGRSDSTFSVTGISTPFISSSYHTVANISIQPDGKILATGIMVDLFGQWDGVVCRFLYGSILSAVSAHSPLNEMTVFPNPSSGVMTLNLQSEFETTLNITVMDLMGRIFAEPVKNRTLTSGISQFQLDLRDLPSGTYLLQARAGEAAKTHRIIIAH